MKLSLVDFKKHEFLEEDLSGDVRITGSNGQGKTAILEGILFAIFGRSFYGKVGTDVLIKEGSKCATATITLGDTEIKRTQSKENTVYLNGVESKISEIASMFPSVEMAYPVINPLYFMYEMSDADKRALFAKILPKLDRDEIFRLHFSQDPELLSKFNSYTIRSIREQIKGFETILMANQSQIETYQLEISTKQSEIVNLREDSEMPKGVLEREKDFQRELEQVQSELAYIGNPQVRIDEYKEELSQAEQEAKPYIEKLKAANLTEALSAVQGYREKLGKVIEDTKVEIAQIKATLKSMELFDSGKCPTCGQSVDKILDRTPELTEQLNTLTENVEKYLSKYSEIKTLDGQLQDIKSTAIRCSNAIKLHSANISKFKKLTARVKELQDELVGINKEDFAKAVDIENRKAQVKIIQGDIMRKKGTISKLEDSNTKIEKSLPELEMLESALSNKGVDAWVAKEQAKLLEKLLKPYMEVSIVTVLENKTNDNTKEVFEVTKDGVSFRSMSFGERIKLAVAFGLVIRELIPGFNLPFVLLDEASVLSEDTLDTIKGWLKEKQVNIIYTKATNTKLKIEQE